MFRLTGALMAATAFAWAADAGKLPPIETERGVLVHTVPGVRNGNHVQGFCADGDYIYVSQMIQLTKFDWKGNFIKKVEAPSHTGDICAQDGRIYAAVAAWGPGSKKDGPKGGIYEYDTDLNFLRKVEFDQGLDGIAVIDGVIYAGYGPNPMAGHLTNRFIRVDAKTLKTIDVKEVCYGVKTSFGCQNAASDGKGLFAIFYNGEKPLAVFDRELNLKSIPDASAFYRSCGEGFERVPASRAGGRDLFMRLRTMNRFVRDRDREPIYAFIDFFEYDRAGNRLVNVTASRKNGRLDRSRLNIGAYTLTKSIAPAAATNIWEGGVDFLVGYNIKHTDKASLDSLKSVDVGCVIPCGLPHWWGGDNRNGKMRELLPPARYESAAKAFKDHPAIWGVDVVDEPSALDFPYVGETVARVRKGFPRQFPYVNLYPSYASAAKLTADQARCQLGTKDYPEHLERYCAEVPLDYICFDCYTWGWRNTPQTLIDNLEMASTAARRHGKSMWIVLQCNTYAENGRRGRRMTLDTLRYQAYTAMAFGAETILWACWNGWWTDNAVDTNDVPTATFAVLKTVNGEIHRLGTDYMKYRTVRTDIVEKGAASTGGTFSGVRADDGSRLAVGHMESRYGSGRHAMFVASCGNPDDASARRMRIRFKAKGEVVARSGEGPVPVVAQPDGTCSVEIASSGGVLIVTE